MDNSPDIALADNPLRKRNLMRKRCCGFSICPVSNISEMHIRKSNSVSQVSNISENGQDKN
jgi:hypothetical protein